MGVSLDRRHHVRKGQEQRVRVSSGSWACGRSRCFQVDKGARVRTGCFSRNEDENHWETEKPDHPSGQVRNNLEKKTSSVLPDTWSISSPQVCSIWEINSGVSKERGGYLTEKLVCAFSWEKIEGPKMSGDSAPNSLPIAGAHQGLALSSPALGGQIWCCPGFPGPQTPTSRGPPPQEGPHHEMTPTQGGSPP